MDPGLLVFTSRFIICGNSYKNSIALQSFTMTFPWLLMTYVIFHDFPGLINGVTKSHDFPWPADTHEHTVQEQSVLLGRQISWWIIYIGCGRIKISMSTCTYTVFTPVCGSYLLTFFCFSSCSIRCLYQSSSSCFACSRHSAFWRSDSASDERNDLQNMLTF